ncbi:MAG: C-terminal helicase domain-containing protein, partial [Opitutaceae bacterium]
RSQSQRQDALAGFKEGRYDVMVATDIASRGIDVAGVSHVINYDIPMTPDDYVHRIGRTGRAAASGDAFTLVTPEDAGDLRAIERFIKATIPQLKLEGFDYNAAIPAPQPGEPRLGGRTPHPRREAAARPAAPGHHPKGKPGGHWRSRGRR